MTGKRGHMSLWQWAVPWQLQALPQSLTSLLQPVPLAQVLQPVLAQVCQMAPLQSVPLAQLLQTLPLQPRPLAQ